MHISKPFWQEDVLVVNVVNPTAGLFAGDRVRCEATVRRGASLLLTSSSAQRVHSMREGDAQVSQRFVVHGGAWIEVLPEILIPQAYARYHQRTVIEAEQGAQVIYFETLAPGRVASGEILAYQQLDLALDVSYGGKAIVRERCRITPGSASVAALTTHFPGAYYGQCLALGPPFFGDVCSSLEALNGASVVLGASKLAAGGWSAKILARSAQDLRLAMRKVRAVLHGVAGRDLPNLRRL